MSVRTVAIVQARMSSTRLPGKVLRPILGEPMLGHVMSRLQQANALDEVVIATSQNSDDDVLAELALGRSWAIWRGSRDDVLDRYVGAATAFHADVIVRVTSDCPLIDPWLVDDVARGVVPGIDYCSNTIPPRTFPRGLDCEAISRDALEEAWREDLDPASREHVTPFLYQHPDRFRLRRLANDVDRSNHRWCVDVPEDLALVTLILDALGTRDFGWHDVLRVCEAHSDWAKLNQSIRQKDVGD